MQLKKIKITKNQIQQTLAKFSISNPTRHLEKNRVFGDFLSLRIFSKSVELSFGKLGFENFRFGKLGFGKFGFGKLGLKKIRFGKLCLGKFGDRQARFRQVRWSASSVVGKLGLGKFGIGKLGGRQVRWSASSV